MLRRRGLDLAVAVSGIPPPPHSLQADAVVLGGSGAFRTDGSTQLGVRKLISGIQGMVYDTDWLPSPSQARSSQPVPIWLW
jgi:hypothetical protein